MGFLDRLFRRGQRGSSTRDDSLQPMQTPIQDSSGGKAGGLIVGATFLLMGVPALLLSLWRLVEIGRASCRERV